MKYKTELVSRAMLAIQRYPWEQGVCAQALYETGDFITSAAMAHDAVLRQRPDGRLAVIGDNIAVTDPAASGEPVWRAYEMTGQAFYKEGAMKMLDYLLEKAPRTKDGIIYHNEISFDEGFTPDQIWVDSIYMAPPFLAVMGHLEEAVKQIEGYLRYLRGDDGHNLLYHIYDVSGGHFVRKKLWATGNGWALMGIGRCLDIAISSGQKTIGEKLKEEGVKILDEMLMYQREDGRFFDTLDDPSTFVDGTSAMMMSAFVFRGIYKGWLDSSYCKYAQRVVKTMEGYIDNLGIIHEVCGCPDFLKQGTSAESMAAYLMMHAWLNKLS